MPKIIVLFNIIILFGVVETEISLNFSGIVVSVIEKTEYKVASIATVVDFNILSIYLN